MIANEPLFYGAVFVLALGGFAVHQLVIRKKAILCKPSEG